MYIVPQSAATRAHSASFCTVEIEVALLYHTMQSLHYRTAVELGQSLRHFILQEWPELVLLTQQKSLRFTCNTCLRAHMNHVCIELQYIGSDDWSFDGIQHINFDNPCVSVSKPSSDGCEIKLLEFVWLLACKLSRGVFDTDPTPATTIYPLYGKRCALCGYTKVKYGAIHCTDSTCLAVINIYRRASYLLWGIGDYLCADVVGYVAEKIVIFYFVQGNLL